MVIGAIEAIETIGAIETIEAIGMERKQIKTNIKI